MIAVTNLKGGVGKTTLTTNLAVSFQSLGYQVCVVDTDLGQQSAMEWGGSRSEHLPAVPVFGIALKQLNKDIEALKDKYDLIFVDGSPQISELADRTILASDLLIIPITPSIYDYRGFESFLERFEKVKELKHAAGAEMDAFVVFNRVVPNTNISKDIAQAVQAYDLKILATQLVNRVAYADSATEGLGVLEYKDPKAALEIKGLTDELLTYIQ